MTSMTPTGVAYDDRGRGNQALLFLPGWCGPRTLFDPLLARLEGTRRAIAVDWRGHGDSKPAEGDFGAAELVEDALAVIDHAAAGPVVPVAAAHAGWIALELRRRLGPERVPRLVFLDWMVLGAPPPFLEALTGMAAPATTRAVVDQVTAMWVGDLDLPALSAYVASMAAMPDDMWARAAREIARAFDQHGAPLGAVDALDPTPPTLHLYAQPADPAFLDAQRRYAATHRWFTVEHLGASSHFPILEVPDAIADHLRAFTAH
jgi:pimeloyl-ACP methyl ester carboxylesterase